MRDICEFLGSRADKDFLGTGNLGLIIREEGARLLFIQRWLESEYFAWASGSVRAWAPDRVEMNEPVPPFGARISLPSSARWIFVTRDDLVGMTLMWKNETAHEVVIQAAFGGRFPGWIRASHDQEVGILCSSAPYSDRVDQPVHFMLDASLAPQQIEYHGEEYEVSFMVPAGPGTSVYLTIFLGIGFNPQEIEESLKGWKKTANPLATVRQDWNRWFDQEVPRFQCSDPYFEKLYYYRWWSLYTKMIFARVGHLLYPAPREGAIMYEALNSHSSACVSIDELRWMRNPAWAYSTSREFFDPQNLNDGYLANHIWDWGIDEDESNQDVLGRSVPYQNYAVAAFYGTLLVHPEEGLKILPDLWPQLRSNLESYPRLFDVDRDGLYETFPWSNSSGQEWTARYLYFHPIAELFRYERGRTYSPDGSRAEEDLELVRKIQDAVVTAPEVYWPQTAEEMYRLYYGTRDHRQAAVDQSTYAYKNFETAAQLARHMGDAAAEKRYARMAEQTRKHIFSVMWNAEDAFFYDVMPVIYQQARVKSVTGFYVFWARIAEQKHLKMLRHLFNPATFWTEYPLPSLPLDYEKYAELKKTNWTYWNYYTWPRTTCHVVDGLLWAAKTLDPSLTKQAALLFEKYTHMHFLHNDIRTPNIAERYDPHTAEPNFGDLDYNHSSWIDLLMRHVAGITPQESDEIVIDPVDMGWKSFSLTHIRYRNHDIDIEYSRDQGFAVHVDGVERAKAPGLRRMVV